MKLKLTPWYSGDQKPLPDRTGPFLREYPFTTINGNPSVGYSWWNGFVFGEGFTTVAECKRKTKQQFRHSPYQSLPWRGVLK